GLYGTAIVYIAESGGAPPAGEGPYPSNLGLAVTPLEVTLDKGGSPQEFTAAGVEPNTVTWRLTGGTDTNISGSTVTVGGNETAEKITVRAEAGSLSGTAVIRVRGNESEPVVVNNGIRIEPAAANVAPGTSRVFGAYDSINESSAAVTWQVTGGGSGTSVNGGGKLEVALEEKAAYLTLRAEMSGGRYGTAAVKVTHESEAPVNLPVPVNNGITVIPGIITLAKGGQGTSFTALDGNGSPADVSWTLEASGTLADGTEIDEDGLLSVGSGQDTGYITVRADGDDEVYGTAIVYINDTGEGHPFDGGIAVSPGSVEAAAGGQIDFTAKLSGTDALAPVTWSLDPGGNGESMIDSDTGHLTLGAGEASNTVLVVRAVKSDGRYGTARVTVTNQNPVVTSVTVSPDAQTIPRGGKYQFIANVEVQYGASPDVEWSIETSVKTGTSVEGGLVTVAADETPGTFTIRATSTADGDMYGEAVITVPAPAEVALVTVDPDEAVVMPGNGKQFNATVTGTGNPAQTVSWTVSGKNHSNTGIDASGYLIVAIGETAASLTVRAISTENPNKYGEAVVTVPAVVDEVTVTPAAAVVRPGNGMQFGATVEGTGSLAQTVLWTVFGQKDSNTDISGSGYLLVAIGETAASLTVRAISTENPNKYGEAVVTVPEPAVVTMVTVTPAAAVVMPGNGKQFNATVWGTGSPAQTVSWTVSGGTDDTGINESGYLTVAIGETAASLTVKATSIENPNKYREAVVHTTSTGEWVDVNSTNDNNTGDYVAFGVGQDGKFYVGSNSNGIKQLDTETGNLSDTAINTGTYYDFGMGQDGKLYAAGGGIMRLNDSGQWETANITSGYYSGFGMGQDGKLYAGSRNKGIMRLNDSGQWETTNITSGYYYGLGMGQDGKLYAAGSNDNGIMRLNDSGQWETTDITSGTYYGFGMGQDGRLYVGSSESGIMRLNDSGQWETTNITGGRYRYFGMGQDGRLYVSNLSIYIPSSTSGGSGIKRLELNSAGTDYEWVSTNVTRGYYKAFGIGPDGKLYAGGWGKVGVNWLGIKRLE
ncbi:MAG: Ig-like domain-containing protein, partial [Spirochaetaceae bacterium]|nr:Ig-like domain-containing protein [Spirochaetaceae bacterium]